MIIKLGVFLFVSVLTYGIPLDQFSNENPVYRLPENAVEVEVYNLELKISKDTFHTSHKFEGITIILFKNLKDTNEIKLHANKLTFSNIELARQDSSLIALEYVQDAQTDILTVTTEDQLLANTSYMLRFSYTAEFRTNEMYGFYKSTYLDSEGNEHVLGTTQFQPTHARKVFPCFDEPSYKAEFEISIRHPKEYNAIGNTRGSTLADPSDDNYVITYFSATPRMSTYLVAFVISDFTCTDSTPIEAGVSHTVCSRSETASLREIAVRIGPQLVHVMENFTGIKYSASTITKMHQVAIPDFSAGAMENWGLLTYRETGLLWDPDLSSNSYLQGLENVVSHEIAHMWFGNLVTTHWWSDTFLNEGFARFFQYFATAEIEKDWQLDKQFVAAQVQSILASDAQETSAALSSPASSPSEVSGRFSSISYNKGASIIRMLQHVIGYENFKKGLQKYLSENKFKNTKPENLWNSLQEFITEGILPEPNTLAHVVDNWINKPGYPLLKVEADGNNIVITQKRFLVSGESNVEDQWFVPITYSLSSDSNKFENTATQKWLIPSNTLTIENVLEKNDWIILNNQQTGYYRINYDDTILSKIQTALHRENFDGIIDLNRAQLVDDIYNLAKIGVYPYSKMFDFMSFLHHDTSYYPWYSAINAFSSMLQRTSNEKIRNSLSTWILDLIASLYDSVPFDQPKNDDQIYTFNRVQANTWACRLGNQECIDKAVAAFEQYKQTKIKPDKNLKLVIYCNGLRHSKNAQNDWDFLWDEYRSASLATEKVTILSALGCSTNEAVLHNYLNKSIDPSSGIKQQDALSVFSAVYTQNPGGVDIAFDFLLKNYKAIADYYGTMNSLSNMFSGLAARFTTQSQIDKLDKFIKTTTDLSESLKKSAEVALSNAKTNLQWTTEFEKQLTVYFDVDKSPGNTIKVSFWTAAITGSMLLYNMLFY